MYVGAHGVGVGTVKNLKVANCEFGWIGGSIQSEGIFGRNWPTRFGVHNQGTAVELKYDAEGVSRLARRYGNNAFAVHAVEGDKLH